MCLGLIWCQAFVTTVMNTGLRDRELLNHMNVQSVYRESRKYESRAVGWILLSERKIQDTYDRISGFDSV
jgi:hypothetical protein